MQLTYSARLKKYLADLGYQFRKLPSEKASGWQCFCPEGQVVSDKATLSGCIEGAAKALGGISDSDLGWPDVA